MNRKRESFFDNATNQERTGDVEQALFIESYFQVDVKFLVDLYLSNIVSCLSCCEHLY